MERRAADATAGGAKAGYSGPVSHKYAEAGPACEHSGVRLGHEHDVTLWENALPSNEVRIAQVECSGPFFMIVCQLLHLHLNLAATASLCPLHFF